MSRPDALLAFISYSRTDGTDFVYRLRGLLREIAPHLTPWSDFDRPSGTTFPTAINRALQGSGVLLYVLTPGSVRDKQPNWCEMEVLRAKRWGIPIVPLEGGPAVELPFYLEGLPPLPFVDESSGRWDELRKALQSIGTPEFVAAELEEQRQKTLNAARRAAGAERGRLVDIANWHGARRVEEEQRARSSCADVEPGDDQWRRVEWADRTDARAVHGGFIMVNELPVRPPVRYVDRDDQRRSLKSYMVDDVVRVITVTGGDGEGKTGLLAWLRSTLRDDRTPPSTDAFVYLWARGYRRVTPDTLLADLCRAVPDADAGERLRHGLKATDRWQTKLDQVFAVLADTAVLLVIDDAHVLLDQHGWFEDRDLAAFFTAIAKRPERRVRVIFAAHREPADLHRNMSGRAAKVISLEGGVPMPEAADLLRSLDDGTLGLAAAGEGPLLRLHMITKGLPRLLELVAGVRRADPARDLSSLADGLDDPEEPSVRGALLASILVNIDRTERLVVQAVAAYARPASPAAISYLLQDFVPSLITPALLERLCARYVIHRDGDRYYLPVGDAEVVRATIPPRAEQPTGGYPFTLATLQLRAARYLSLQRVQPRSMDDLWPQFGEIELRIDAGDLETAFHLMNEIDDGWLRRWGQSATLSRWRIDLQSELGDPAAAGRNLSYLAAAFDQQDDLMAAADHVRQLLEVLARTTDVDNRIRARNQLGGVLFRQGHLRMARALYASALQDSMRLGRTSGEAEARMGTALCLARTGNFDQAVGYLDGADEGIAPLPPKQTIAIRARLQLNRSWVWGQLGRTVAALNAARSAGKLAAEAGDDLLRGVCLNGEATHLLYWEGPDRALCLAEEAAKIGTKANNTPLLAEAYVTMALAQLFAGSEKLAIEAARAATELRGTLASVNAFAVLGLATFTAGRIDEADAAFRSARSMGKARFHRKEHDYLMLDAHGLVLSGLAMSTREQRRVSTAIATYRRARKIAATAGVKERNQQLLRCFVRYGDREILEQIRAAANAEDDIGRT